MNIAQFLEARIDEDEAQLASTPTAAQQLDDFDYGGTDDYLRFTIGYGRAVAECAAKRAIISQAEEATGDRGTVIAEHCGSDAERAQSWAEDPGELILKALASVYSDHPDYQQEWAA